MADAAIASSIRAASVSPTRWAKPLLGAAAISLALALPWLWALATPAARTPGGAGLVVAQIGLAVVLAALVLGEVRAVAGGVRPPGPRLALAGHTLIFYTAANIVPALRPDVRPEFFYVLGLDRIPTAPVASYTAATAAAVFLLAGVWAGIWLAEQAPLFLRLDGASRRVRGRWWWLPSPRAALLCAAVLALLVGIATVRYGRQFDVLMTAELSFTDPVDQLLAYGVMPFLGLTPLLVAAAMVQQGPGAGRGKRLTLVLTASILFTLVCLAVWRMRSTAIISMALPLGLLVLSGRLSARRFLLIMIVGAPLIYGAVTAARLAMIEQSTGISVGEVSSGDEERSVAQQALFDASYRAAGLEASAALLNAQEEGRLRLRGGEVIASGFFQALPASLRPSRELPERMKTAPTHFGIFSQGDWVATVLPEFVLDFGGVWLLLPACLFGFGLAFLDRALLWLGALGGLDGLLAVRLAWVLSLMLEGSVADRTLMFGKAIVGYGAVLILVGLAARTRAV